MSDTRHHIIVAFFVAVAMIVTYRIIRPTRPAPEVHQARTAYAIARLQADQERLHAELALTLAKLRVAQANLQRADDLQFYGLIGLLSVVGIAGLIAALGYHQARVRRASICLARIGRYSAIPVYVKDLPQFYPIAVNLSLAEIEASAGRAHDQAYQISRQMLADIGHATRALTGKHGGANSPGLTDVAAPGLPAMTATPTFAELLRAGTLAPGAPLVLGYDRQGQPQTRALTDLKSVAVTGWQGSGKTLSMGYLVASGVLTGDAQVFLVDPHGRHPESLTTLLQPLITTGRVTSVNPFDTPTLLNDLNATLDRRLAGTEANTPAILVVLDELERFVKLACFDGLVAFLERCTAETRKANITFIGGSPKWTARHFQGRADIRACMNSLLIHKTKPSQADLLLEDAHDKRLVKELQRPGEAILVTDYAPATVVAIPFCTRQDMATVATLVGARQPTPHTTAAVPAAPLPTTARPAAQRERPLSLLRSRADHLRQAAQSEVDPLRLTAEQINAQLTRRKAATPDLTQAAVARQAGLSPSVFGKILRGQRPLKPQEQLNLYAALFVEGAAARDEDDRNARRVANC